MTMRIPLVDLKAQQAEIADDVRDDLAEVFASAGFIGGPHVAAFEREYADYLGVKHVIGVGNGTDALELALRATGIEPGAEVIVPANSFIATAEAVSRAGAVPVLVDVDPVYLLIDPEAVAAAITPRTQAILPVHLYGQVAPMDALDRIAQRAGITLLEDAAQSQGARGNGVAAGTFGMAAGTSFYPGKNLGAAGDAGAVLTDDDEVATRTRAISAHGGLRKYEHRYVGFNSRLDAVQAVVLRAKLARLDGWNEARRRAAAHYQELLSGTHGVFLPHSRPGNTDVWHLYVVRVAQQQALIESLERDGVSAGIHYPTPIHLTEAYQHLGYLHGAFPVTEAAATQIVSLPLYPHITAAQQHYVAESVERALVTADDLVVSG
jgi:dTDP-4-amino-4,6-dideoxygalactose transaminase